VNGIETVLRLGSHVLVDPAQLDGVSHTLDVLLVVVAVELCGLGVGRSARREREERSRRVSHDRLVVASCTSSTTEQARCGREE
jgi:hypothetical protein